MGIISMRIGDADLQGLDQLCREIIRKTDTVVEIGSYTGQSSGIIARYARKLYCIDRWKDGVTETGASTRSRFEYRDMSKVESLFDAAMAGHANVIKVRGDSSDLSDVFGDDTVDFVYIDALHDYEAVRNDIRGWWPKVLGGGYIGGHNHHPRWPGVIRSVQEAFGGPDKLYRDSSWIVRKRSGRGSIA